MIGLVALIVFSSVGIAGYGLSVWLRDREDTQRAQAKRLSAMTGTVAPGVESPLLKDLRLSSIGLLNALLSRLSVVAPMVRMIRQARMERRVGEVLLYIPLLGCIGFLGTMLMGGGRLAGLLIGVILASIPVMMVRRIGRKRAQLFSDQLPDALDLIRAALQAGHGFLSSLSVVADEFPNPIAEELRDVAEEIRLGMPMRDALYNLQARIDDPTLPILVVGVLVSHEVGGNLAEVLENISHTIRERFKLQREMQVMTAQGRLSGRVLTALPFIVALTMNFINPAYFVPMVRTTQGNYMLAYAGASLVMGHLVIRRLVNIRV